MPMRRELYPKDWEAIALAVKQKAKWKCQECGKPCRRPGESPEKFFKRLRSRHHRWLDELFPALDYGWASEPKFGRFTLTVAHLNHRPADCSPTNLRALCAPCHCRYDLRQMPRKRMVMLELQGQQNLLAHDWPQLVP